MLVSTHPWLLIEGVKKHQKRVPQKIFVLNHPTLSFQNILQSQQDKLKTRDRTKGLVHTYVTSLISYSALVTTIQ